MEREKLEELQTPEIIQVWRESCGKDREYLEGRNEVQAFVEALGLDSIRDFILNNGNMADQLKFDGELTDTQIDRKFEVRGEVRQFFIAVKTVGIIYPADAGEELIEDMDAAGMIEDATHPDIKDFEDEELEDIEPPSETDEVEELDDIDDDEDEGP